MQTLVWIFPVSCSVADLAVAWKTVHIEQKNGILLVEKDVLLAVQEINTGT